MEKSCKNCVSFSKIRDKCMFEVVFVDECSRFLPRCMDCGFEEAFYELDGEVFCSDCMLKHLNIERVEVLSYEFYFDGEYCGNDNDNEIGILQNVNKNVKELEY